MTAWYYDNENAVPSITFMWMGWDDLGWNFRGRKLAWPEFSRAMPQYKSAWIEVGPIVIRWQNGHRRYPFVTYGATKGYGLKVY